MPECPFNSILQAYHDGQTSAERTREAERHVATCAACAAELARLRDLSALFHGARPEPIRPGELARLHEVVDEAADGQDRRVLRLAVGLSAVAASILIISTAWLYDGPPGRPGHTTVSTSSGSNASQREAWQNIAAGHVEEPAGARPTGTAMKSTIDWMIGSTKGEGVHGSP